MPSRTTARSDRADNEEPVDVLVAGEPVLRLTPQSHRVAVGLIVPPSGRVVDISVQPGAACRALADAQRRSRSAPSVVDAAVRAAVHTAARRASAWIPPEDLCWSHLFGGAAFPLLGAAYELDAAPVLEVPRWAAPALGSRTIGEAATAVFATAATRPVRRALVGAIAPLPDGEVDLSVLALALMGAPALQPDRLARVLSAERVHQPSADLPDPATMRATRDVIRAWVRAGWAEARLERVLVDAAGRPDGTPDSSAIRDRPSRCRTASRICTTCTGRWCAAHPSRWLAAASRPDSRHPGDPRRPLGGCRRVPGTNRWPRRRRWARCPRQRRSRWPRQFVASTGTGSAT